MGGSHRTRRSRRAGQARRCARSEGLLAREGGRHDIRAARGQPPGRAQGQEEALRGRASAARTWSSLSSEKRCYGLGRRDEAARGSRTDHIFVGQYSVVCERGQGDWQADRRALGGFEKISTAMEHADKSAELLERLVPEDVQKEWAEPSSPSRRNCCIAKARWSSEVLSGGLHVERRLLP